MSELTEQQRAAVESRGKDLIVSAGAGSGKTTVMIERICALLREGADLRQMVVCTFTKTAAASMKQKLAKMLNDSNDERLRKQLRRLPSAEISTLHSWCAHIIKKWFFDAGVDPEFGVLEEGEANALKSEAAEEAISAEKKEGEEGFAELYEVLSPGRSDRELKKILLKVYDFSRAQSDPEGWLKLGPAMTDRQYRDLLHEEVKKETQSFIAVGERLLSEMRAAGFFGDEVALTALVDCMRRNDEYVGTTGKLSKQSPFYPLHERYKDLRDTYSKLYARHQAIEDMPSHERSEKYIEVFRRLVKKTGELYEESKRARRKLDYSDLEHTALKILCGIHSEGIVSEYKYVFVDEYQDISPLQESILGKFTCRMFFVGDIKQSIYGFRMCSPEFFRDKFKAYAGGAGEALELTANFRSGGEILNAVNSVFSRVMTEDFGRVDYATQQLSVGREIPSTVKAAVIEDDLEEAPPGLGIYSVRAANRINGKEGDDGGDDASEYGEDGDERDSRKSDCQAALVLKEIVDYLVGDADGKREFKDIAVLVRSRGEFTDSLQRKLRAMSIPVTFVASDTVADDFPSVAALIAVLRLLDNARDDVNLAAVMLTSAFGDFDGEDLAELRLCESKEFCDCVYGYGGGNKKLAAKVGEFTRKLDRLRGYAAVLTVGELAGKITSENNFFNYALTLGGEREAAALDAYLEHLSAQTEHDSLHEYIRFVARAGLPKLNVASGGNAVRIMTVHGAKGLEFPFVILPELEKNFNRMDLNGRVIYDRNEGIVMRDLDFTERRVTASPRFEVCVHEKLRLLQEEELRILYVAMTRAEKRLFLCSVAPKTASEEKTHALNRVDWLYDALDSVTERVKASSVLTGEVKVSSSRPRKANGKIVKMLKKQLRDAQGHVPARRAVKASVSGIIHKDEENKPKDVFCGDDRAALKGSAYHKFMQWVDFGREGEYDRLSARFPDEGKLVDRAEIERAFEDMRRFIGGREFYRERQFVLSLDGEEVGESAGDVLVQGVIDLLIVSPDGSVDIVDYKTGRESHLQNETYARQLGMYRKAVCRILGVSECRTYLYGFSAGKLVEIKHSD